MHTSRNVSTLHWSRSPILSTSEARQERCSNLVSNQVDVSRCSDKVRYSDDYQAVAEHDLKPSLDEDLSYALRSPQEPAPSTTEPIGFAMPPPVCQSLYAEQPDNSELYAPSRTMPPSHPFVFALGLWVEQAHVSRMHWTALLEVLALLDNTRVLALLPKKLDTLKRNMRGAMPLQPL